MLEPSITSEFALAHELSVSLEPLAASESLAVLDPVELFEARAALESPNVYALLATIASLNLEDASCRSWYISHVFISRERAGNENARHYYHFGKSSYLILGKPFPISELRSF